MNEIIKDIFEKYQIRKTRRQKTAFIEYATQKAEEEGYSVRVEKGCLGVRNIVVGEPDTAKVIYTAHYDTCPRLPFPNFLTPKNFGVYLLYNVALVLAIIAVMGLMGGIVIFAGLLLDLHEAVLSVLVRVLYAGLFVLLLFGPANKHTANDNTSGVTLLFGIMKALPEEQREKAAFVFFDHEELGLIGSSSFAGKHKAVRSNTLLINFDCVSDGQNILIVAKKAAAAYSALLSEAFASHGDFAVQVTEKAFYPSDQAKFKKGVGVAAFKRTRGGMLYMNRIHTSKDTVYRRENIDFFIHGAVRLTETVE